MTCPQALQCVSGRKRLYQYVAQKLSRLPATDGKEKSHGDGSLPLRKVRLEGLAALIPCFRDCQHFGALTARLAPGFLYLRRDHSPFASEQRDTSPYHHRT